MLVLTVHYNSKDRLQDLLQVRCDVINCLTVVMWNDMWRYNIYDGYRQSSRIILNSVIGNLTYGRHVGPVHQYGYAIIAYNATQIIIYSAGKVHMVEPNERIIVNTYNT